MADNQRVFDAGDDADAAAAVLTGLDVDVVPAFMGLARHPDV